MLVERLNEEPIGFGGTKDTDNPARDMESNPVYQNRRMALSQVEVELARLRVEGAVECDDSTARIANCKLPEELQNRIDDVPPLLSSEAV